MSPARSVVRDTNAPDYWESGRWLSHGTSRLWRAHADYLHGVLLERWIGNGDGLVLKTDLYEEAVGAGQVPWLAERFAGVSGIDISEDVQRVALSKNPGIDTRVADTRALPFEDGRFETIVSLSTLDHFEDPADIGRSLAELSRVLAPGGRLVLTLDNPANPVVWLRQNLPRGAVDRSGLVPYFCGATVHPRDMAEVLAKAGLVVEAMSANMHCPRVLAVPVARFLDARAPEGLKRFFSRLLRRFEILERLPTRYRTGHFTAVLCRKPPEQEATGAPEITSRP